MAMRHRPVWMTLATLVLIGAIGWIGIVMIGLQLSAASAGNLGFDLGLLLQAGRDIAAGRSPYAPELIGGSAPTATSLFYSYPPPVGQAMVPFAGVPSTVMLAVWGALAVGGLLSGIWLGLFVGLIFSLFGEEGEVLSIILSTVLFGAIFGLVWGLVGYLATRGRRDFTSVSQVVATRYEVLVEHKYAEQGRQLLATMGQSPDQPFGQAPS